jgi:gamma-resorcylate decarboxylase
VPGLVAEAIGQGPPRYQERSSRPGASSTPKPSTSCRFAKPEPDEKVTATHLLRVIYSGVFDRFPAAKVVVGHLGETIPYNAWRIQHCFEHSPRNDKVKLRLQDYLDQNVWITTSGNHSTVALQCAMETMGTDRIMFSVDYPFENMDEAADWIETCDISEDDRSKIAYGNEQRLLKL